MFRLKCRKFQKKSIYKETTKEVFKKRSLEQVSNLKCKTFNEELVTTAKEVISWKGEKWMRDEIPKLIIIQRNRREYRMLSKDIRNKRKEAKNE